MDYFNPASLLPQQNGMMFNPPPGGVSTGLEGYASRSPLDTMYQTQASWMAPDILRGLQARQMAENEDYLDPAMREARQGSQLSQLGQQQAKNAYEADLYRAYQSPEYIAAKKGGGIAEERAKVLANQITADRPEIAGSSSRSMQANLQRDIALQMLLGDQRYKELMASLDLKERIAALRPQDPVKMRVAALMDKLATLKPGSPEYASTLEQIKGAQSQGTQLMQLLQLLGQNPNAGME